jgi:hypothetical protein
MSRSTIILGAVRVPVVHTIRSDHDAVRLRRHTSTLLLCQVCERPQLAGLVDGRLGVKRAMRHRARLIARKPS